MKPERQPGKRAQDGRIPSLDGLRAVSIGMVLVAHSRIEHTVGPTLKPLVAIVGNGPLGVSIFFVISGFLITKLLLAEEDQSGALSLRDFYVRRAFRILPACYVFLAALLILKALGIVTVSPLGWLSAAFFLRNYALPVDNADWYTAHCWSLSVEEQFYLLWPLILRVLGRRRARWIASVLIATGPFSRAITYAILPSARIDIIYLTHTRVDTLMFGCLTALLWHSVRFQEILRRVFALRFPLLLAIGVLVMSAPLTTAYGGRYLFTVGYTLEGLSIVILLLWVVEHADGPIGRVLNSRPLVHVGVLSYSMYLWQQWLMSYPLPSSLLVTFIAAEGSHRLIERPFLRLRTRFLRKRLSDVPLEFALEAAQDAPPLASRLDGLQPGRLRKNGS